MKPVVALDIDGTLGDYHGQFLQFAADWYGREMPDASDINPGLPLHKFMKTSKAMYRQCKLAYRQGGLERSMPAYDGASELTHELRRFGVEVWLCTTRPYLKMDTQSPNTLHWLRRNKIQYDHLLSGPHKYRDLVKQIRDRNRVVAVLDDLPEMYDQADSLGLPAILRSQPYNQHRTDASMVSDLWDAQKTILAWLDAWSVERNYKKGMVKWKVISS